MQPTVDPKTGMTARQQLFLNEYLKEPNATKAARAAGYKNPNVAGPNLTNPAKYPAVANAIAEAMAVKERQAAIDAAEIVRGLAAIARFNLQDVLDEDGKPIPLHLLPRDVAAAISEYEVSHRMGVGTDGKAIKLRAVKIKAHSKMEAYKQLAMHLGVFNEWAARMANGGNTTVNNTTVNNHTTVNMNWAQLAVKDLPDPVHPDRLLVPPTKDEPPLEREHLDED